MTIIFHSKYPLNQASFSFGSEPYTVWSGFPLTTDANGDLYILEYPDGAFPYAILYFGGDSKTYTGTVTVSNNNGYVDVTLSSQPAPNYMLVIGGVLAVAFALGVAYWKHWI